MNEIAFQPLQLAQSRPNSTSAVSILNPVQLTMVTSIYVANTTSIATTFSIYHDVDGTTYDETTVIFPDVAIAGNTTVKIGEELLGISVTSGSNFAVATGTADALNFTIYGKERIQ